MSSVVSPPKGVLAASLTLLLAALALSLLASYQSYLEVDSKTLSWDPYVPLELGGLVNGTYVRIFVEPNAPLTIMDRGAFEEFQVSRRISGLRASSGVQVEASSAYALIIEGDQPRYAIMIKGLVARRPFLGLTVPAVLMALIGGALALYALMLRWGIKAESSLSAVRPEGLSSWPRQVYLSSARRPQCVAMLAVKPFKLSPQA